MVPSDLRICPRLWLIVPWNYPAMGGVATNFSLQNFTRLWKLWLWSWQKIALFLLVVSFFRSGPLKLLNLSRSHFSAAGSDESALFFPTPNPLMKFRVSIWSESLALSHAALFFQKRVLVRSDISMRCATAHIFHTSTAALDEIWWVPGWCNLILVRHSIVLTDLQVIRCVVVEWIHRWPQGRKCTKSGPTPAIPIAVSPNSFISLIDISNLQFCKNILIAGSGSDPSETKPGFHLIFGYFYVTTHPKVIAVWSKSSIATRKAGFHCWSKNIS